MNSHFHSMLGKHVDCHTHTHTHKRLKKITSLSLTSKEYKLSKNPSIFQYSSRNEGRPRVTRFDSFLVTFSSCHGNMGD